MHRAPAVFSLFVALIICVKDANAQVIYQTGFEAPAFVDGNLAGQDSWLSTDSPPTPGLGTVQSVFSLEGARSVKVDAAAGFSSVWYYQSLGYTAQPNTVPIVQIRWSMYLSDAGIQKSFLWGIDLYDNTPFSSRRITAAGVNAAGGLQVWDLDHFVDTGFQVSRNTWHEFTVNIDYRAGRKRVTVVVDDQLAATGMRISAVATETIADVDLYHIDGGGDDYAFYDALSVIALTDGDLDGIPDGDDACPATVPGEPVDGVGCSTLDNDNDGVPNDIDLCPATPDCTLSVDASGCPNLDSDNDGAPDGCDNCPGLSNPDQTDTDGDGDGDACDLCPDLAFGDLNGDQAFNGGDIRTMIDIVIAGTATQAELCAADFNSDDVIDLDDIPLMIDLLLQN